MKGPESAVKKTGQYEQRTNLWAPNFFSIAKELEVQKDAVDKISVLLISVAGGSATMLDLLAKLFCKILRQPHLDLFGEMS